MFRLEKARTPLKCALCTKLCTRLSRVCAYFKPVARVSLSLRPVRILPASTQHSSLIGRTDQMPGLRASLPNRYNRLLLLRLSVYIRNWFSFEDLLLWNSIVGDLPIKSNTFGLFSFERGEYSDNGEHSPRHSGDRRKNAESWDWKLPSLKFSSAPGSDQGY